MTKQKEIKCLRCGEVRKNFYLGVCHECHRSEVAKLMKNGSLPIGMFGVTNDS